MEMFKDYSCRYSRF